MKKTCLIFILAGMTVISCTTTKSMNELNDFVRESSEPTLEEEYLANDEEKGEFLIQEELKVQDVKDTVIYVEKPVYVPENRDDSETGHEKITGYDAVKDSIDMAVQKPENYRNGTFFYQFNEDFVYEIYAQPYHLTDIVLEDGEIVIGTPLLSEDESVWELTAGVARNPVTGEDIQHLFIKPTYSRQDSTLIIITDRRVYHFRLLSFSDTHMAMVRFTYPLKKNVWAQKKEENGGRMVENSFIRTSDPSLLSFDYTVRYSRHKKPEFLPQRIYDDGQCTYIEVNESVLQKELPVLFNERNEIINYSVTRNIFVIPRLINKVTLRLGKEKVTVTKSITKIQEK